MQMIDDRLFATCWHCPQRALCRLWRDPQGQWCEHWPVDELPGLPALAARVVVAGVRHALQGAAAAPPEVLEARKNSCAACTHWDAAAFGGRGRCRHPQCGCSGIKLTWAAESCPMGKWPAVG